MIPALNLSIEISGLGVASEYTFDDILKLPATPSPIFVVIDSVERNDNGTITAPSIDLVLIWINSELFRNDPPFDESPNSVRKQ